MPDTATEPSENVSFDLGVVENTRVAEETMYPGDTIYQNDSGTYTGNGASLAGAFFGDSLSEEADIELVQIPKSHPNSNTPSDKDTAFSAGDKITTISFVQGKQYWVRTSSSLTASKGDKLVLASSGRWAKPSGYTTTPLPQHMCKVVKDCSAASWVKVQYIGIVTQYTA